MEFCVDAYNVIFKIASYGRINIESNDTFSRLRDLFITQMVNYFNQRKVLGILVFDGTGPGWVIGGNTHHSQFVQMKYSGQQTADEIMMNHIRNHQNAREITVVTEDNEIIAVAKAYSCRVISSTDFITRITSVADKAEKASSGRHQHVAHKRKPSRASDRKKKIISHLHFADIENEFRKISMEDIFKELAEEDGIDYTD